MNKEKTGVLFRNKKKKEGSQQPDYTGKVTFDGQEMQMAAWIKDGKTGKYLSFVVKDPLDQRSTSDFADEVINANNDPDDGMPF